MQKGTIGVSTENIFPIIKQFLYSEQEIFLREIVSNAVDATQKLKTLSRLGEYKGDVSDAIIRVIVDKDKKTITVADQGIGMTSEEIQKYINQIAFSGANEFLDKYKDKVDAIIGHFGLGFYSTFMVAKKVEIETLSYKEGSQAVKWECDGSQEFSISEIQKDSIGTNIILHIDDESTSYLEDSKITELLTKYCKFLPVKIAFGKEKEWQKDKYVDTDKDKIINNPDPAWTKAPSALKEEDYANFYRELYPIAEEPLFNIHLNVDYPFNLTGILYFPKIKNNIEVQKNKIQLYCNQVFVTDSVEGIVPEFLTLLHGVLDSPDIPLNVSRSYLQGDPNVKKISSHITKKVADRLHDIFKNTREDFEKKWDDLRMFIVYGMLTEEKFYEKAEKFALFKNIDEKFFTFDEYKTLISANQTDKNGTTIYLYTTDKVAQYTYIEKAKAKGYDVIVLDGQLDSHLINQLEQKFEKSQFVRVDSDIIEKIIQKDEKRESKLSESEKTELTPVFKSQTATEHYSIAFENLEETDLPILITQSEYMRRMKEMAKMNAGMGFYGQLPDSYNLVVNANHPLIIDISNKKKETLGSKISTMKSKLDPITKEITDLESAHKGKKDEEIPQNEKDKLEELRNQSGTIEDEINEMLTEFGKNNPVVKQLIDLALIANNMLKGEELNKFVKRSVELINK